MKKLLPQTCFPLRITVVLTSLLLLVASTTKAQSTNKIIGFVQEGGSNALNGVTVSLLKAKDSSLTKAAVSDMVIASSRLLYKLLHALWRY